MIIPKRNEKNLSDLPVTVRDGLDFHLVSHMNEVLPVALVAVPGEGTGGSRGGAWSDW